MSQSSAASRHWRAAPWLLLLVITSLFLLNLNTAKVNADVPSELINVKDYGATGNDTTDDTTAFKNAIAAAKTAGKPVYVPMGRYYISDTLNLEYQTLYGQPEGSYTTDIPTPAQAMKPVLPTLIPTNPAKSVFEMMPDSSLSGIQIWYDRGSRGANPTTFQPTIILKGGTFGTEEAKLANHIRISNVQIDGANVGIKSLKWDATHAVNTGRAVIQDVFLSHVIDVGIDIDGSWDTSTFENLEVWTPPGDYGGKFQNDGTGIIIRKSDAFHLSDVLVFGAATGVKLTASASDGIVWGSLSNVSTDYCKFGIDITDGRITIVGGTHDDHYRGLTIRGNESAVEVTGVRFKSNGDASAVVEGGYSVAISGSQFERGQGSGPALHILGGSKVVVTGSTLASTGEGAVLAGNGLMLFSNNIIAASTNPKTIVNSATNPLNQVNNNIRYPG